MKKACYNFDVLKNMYKNKTIAVVMPGRTVSKILEAQILSIPEIVDQIICVSNKSKDNTVLVGRELEKKYPKFKLIVQDTVDKNGIGYGVAIKTGFLGSSCDLTFKCDADGTYPVNQIENIVDFILKNNLKTISCSRYPVIKGSDVKLFNQLGVYALNIASFFKNGHYINDILSGFYGGYTNEIVELSLQEIGWNFSIEFKIKSLKKFKKCYGEFKIKQNPSLTVSHQNYFKTGWNHLKFIGGFDNL